MPKIVYTYTSIESLDQHPRYSEIKSAPHITATVDLRRAVSDRYSDIQHLTDIHSIQKTIIDNWDDEGTIFQQYIGISSIMRKMSVSELERPFHTSFVKNKHAVLDAIRILVEADSYPEYLSPSNIEERLFKAIWEKLEEEDPSFGKFRGKLAYYYSDPDAFEIKLKDVFNDFSMPVVVLHGFYFITPIQQRFFEMIEKCGKTLIFLSNIDITLPEVEEIWYQNFSEDRGFPPADEWIGDEVAFTLNRPFGTAFGYDALRARMENVVVKKYDSEMDFVHETKRLFDGEYTIYSTDIVATEKLLKEFYPERFNKRHLLAYPVGQYIFQLHSMWKVDKQRLEFTVEDIQACFSSGWVATDSVGGQNHMVGLELLRTYVSDCRTIGEWETRLDYLNEIKTQVLSTFEGHIDDSLSHNRRWHRMMSNPFTNFSCFSYDEKKLEEMLGLIKHLIFTARELFTGNHEIDISSHLDKVRRLVEENKYTGQLLKEEQAILEELNNRLRFSNLGINKCLPGEISEAIMLIIGGGMIDEESFGFQSGYDDAFIRPLYQIESSPLSGNGKVHLCMADEERMPGRPKSFAWPVSGKMLNGIEGNIPTKIKQYISNMRFIIEKAPVANRYLFFSLLQNENVEISWIANEKEKKIAASPYIQILDSIFGVPVVSPQENSWSVEDIKLIEEQDPVSETIIDLQAIKSDEARMNLMLCPWRYIYGYVLSHQPTYSGDFHYSFALSRLIGVFSHITGDSKKKVSKEVLDLFPYLRDVEKQHIIDHVSTRVSDDTDSLDNVSYPRSRLAVSFLDNKIVAEAENTLNNQQSSKYNLDLGFVAENGICKYCPYKDNCPHANHGNNKEDL